MESGIEQARAGGGDSSPEALSGPSREDLKGNGAVAVG